MTSTRRIRVAYCRVWDADYPRNRRIRKYLEDIDGVEVTIIPSLTGGSKPLRMAKEFLSPVLRHRGYDVYIAAEYGIVYAPAVWLAARLSRAALIVDGFVSKHETIVGDWQKVSHRSLRARVLGALDRFAATRADLYLTDTRVRADDVVRRFGSQVNARSLPVGAPSWATPQPLRRPDGVLRVLFYGLYVPLHGVSTIIEAVAAVRSPIFLTMVGAGALRSEAEDLVDHLGLGSIVRFVDPVLEEKLAEMIADSDVVLGVFGGSTQAETVLPNKVWQGLASGRVVVSRESPALGEIQSLVGDLLRTVPPLDPAALAAALDGIAKEGSTPAAADVADRLEEYVASQFRVLDAFIDGRR